MLTDAEQWERMERVELWNPRVCRDIFLVMSGLARDWVPAVCPECGRVVVADEVRMQRGGDGRRWYYTLHGGELHELGVRGRARRKRTRGRGDKGAR